MPGPCRMITASSGTRRSGFGVTATAERGQRRSQNGELLVSMEWVTGMDTISQTGENREYVRRLLRDRQPDLAVLLESVEREPCSPMCLAQRDERDRCDAVSCCQPV